MKKQLRLVLFAMLVTMLVVMMAIGVGAAATDGAEAREEGHYYEVVSGADGATPKYYTTLASAIAAIDADGYTVKVLDNVTEPVITLDKAYAYTISGGQGGVTITVTSTKTVNNKQTLMDVAAGTVTLDNVTLACATGVTPGYVIALNGATEVVLNNVVTSVQASINTVYINASGALTVSGGKTNISGAEAGFLDVKAAAVSTVTITGGKIASEGYIMFVRGKSTVSITGGELTGGSTNSLFYQNALAKDDSTLTITNATLRAAKGKDVFTFGKAFTVTIGEGTTVYADGGAVFGTTGTKAKPAIVLDGADIHLLGEGSTLYATDAIVGTATTGSGKIYFYAGVEIPAATLDTVFDWKKLTFVVVGFDGVIELTEGTYNVSSPDAVAELAGAVAKKAFDPVRFEGVNIVADIDSSIWIPIVINGEGVVVNVTAGTYRLPEGGGFATLTQGALNITGGSFYASEGTAFVTVSGGALTISGGTFAGLTHAIDATGGTLSVTGGTFSLTGFADTVTNATFLKYTGDAAVVIGAADGSTGPTVILGASVGNETFARGLVLTNAAVNLTVAGTFKTENVKNIIFDVPMDIAKLEIKGGSYTIKGAGASLLPTNLDRENNGVTITGGTVTVADGANVPVFNYIETSVLSLALEGAANFRMTKAGTYNIRSVSDIYKIMEPYFASVTVSGKEAPWIGLTLDCAEINMTIVKGEYAFDGDFFVVKAGTLTITGGEFLAGGNNFILVENGKLNITGGTFKNILNGIVIKGGEVAISGGSFTGTASGQKSVLVDVAGNAKLTITPNTEEDGEDPSFTLPVNSSSIAVYVQSTSTVSISGGLFGNTNHVSSGNYYGLYISAATTVDVTGGAFFGGSGASAIQLAGTGAVLNYSGTAASYGFKNIIAAGDVVVNISGGSFNPHANPETGAILKANCRLVELTNEAAEVNISGGTFNNFDHAINLTKPATVTITGGIFNARTAHADVDVDAFVQVTEAGAGATVIVGDEEEGVGPVVNLGCAASTKEAYPDPHYTKLFSFLGANVSLTLYAGEFNMQYAENELFSVGSPAALDILGGNFTIMGEGTELISDELLANPVTTLENITVTVCDGAAIPYINPTVNETITLVLAGDVKGFELRSGTYTISTLDDIYDILAKMYLTVIVEERAPAGWIPIHLNGDDVNVTLNNVVDNGNCEYLVRVTKGILTVNGGSFSADAGEKLFEVLGSNATATFNGGSYRASGIYSYILYIAEGVDTSKISMKDASLYVAEFGSAPVQVDLTMTNNTIVVNGLSAITISLAKEYTISSAADLTQLVVDALLDSGLVSEQITVEIHTWVPVHLNHPDAVLNITGGQYAGGAHFFFRLSAGTINITGGKFNNAAGDMIWLTGSGNINVDLPTYDRSHGLTSAGSLLYVSGASNATVTIKGGYFVSSRPDTTNDEKKAFIFFDGETRGVTDVTLVIEDGHFEATRMLRMISAGAEVTIKSGEFVSDYFIDDDLVTERAENAHMFVLSGENAKLNIQGGTFDNKDGNYLFVLHSLASAVVDGGSFNGSGWINMDTDAVFTVNANVDPEKNPVFTDTLAVALDDYIIINGAAVNLTINAGTFTAGTSEYYMLAAKQGALTINGGTYKGSLFYVTSSSTVTLNDGTFTATGREGALFCFDSAVSTSNLILSKELNFTVEKNAFIVDTTANAAAIKALLEKANITVTDHAKLGAYLPAEITFASEADVIVFIKTFLPEGKLTFVAEHPVCGLKVYGESQIVVTGGEWDYTGDFIFTLQDTATLTIKGGNFRITNGGLVHITNGAATVVFGDKNDATLCPVISVTDGLKGLFYTEGAGTKLIIYNGSFTANDFADFNMFSFSAETATVEVRDGSFIVTKGSQYDETGTKLQNASSMFYLDGNFVDGVRNGTAKVDFNIYGGGFSAARIIFHYYAGGRVNIYGGSFTSNSYAYANGYMFWLRHKNVQYYIYNGTFTGNKYTPAIMRASDAAGSGSNLMAITITGGTFNKGLHWIQCVKQCHLTIDKTETTSPVFFGLSSGTGSNYGSNVTPHGIYFTYKAVGSNIEIKAGSFRLPSDQFYSLFVTQGGNYTFYDGAVMECFDTVFQIGNSLKMNMTIKGGTFIVDGAATVFDFASVKLEDRTTVVESRIVIEGGTFQAKDAASIFEITSTEPMYSLTVKGGTFSSVDSRLMFISGSAETPVVIEGGTFTSSAVRMIHVDTNVTPLVIKDGTFTFAERDSLDKADNALLYVVGKNAASVVVEGGTFVDNRTGSNQTFIKMNPKGTLDFAGEFKIYVAEQKKNFYFDNDDDANSVPFMSWTETYKGQEYYVCFGYYTQDAPVITTAPVIRPVLGAEGMTFMANISAEAQEYLATLGTVSYGTIIFPTKYFENGWKNGTDFLAVLKAYAAQNGVSESSVYAMIPAVKGLTTEADGSITIRASLVNIKEKNYTLDIAGIAYAKVTAEDGTETYYYATHVSAGVSNNMRAAAKYALNDLNAKAITENGRVYCYASIMKKNRFSRYSSALQYSLRQYLPVSERDPKWW